MSTDIGQLIDFTEQNLGVCFPLSFRELHVKGLQSRYKNWIFHFREKPSGTVVEEGIGSFLSFDTRDQDNMLKKTLQHPILYYRSLVPFVDIGGSCYLCFDYSISGFEDLDPPVVLWLHEYEDIADVAINFQSFLDQLKPFEEDYLD